MKVLFCHNYYKVRGGEDVSFEADVQMLRDYGHEVVPFVRDNSELDRTGRLRAAWNTLWNYQTEKEVAQVIRQERPDVVHCNNTFPILSCSVYRPANQAGIPVVQAIRNYRYFCAAHSLFRDGEICTKCVKKTVAYPAVLHACYRNSHSASAVVASVYNYHRVAKTWQRRVDAFFTPTNFAKDTVVEAGFPESKVHVKTNFVHPDRGLGTSDGGYALYVGRLTTEKGIDTLAQCWTEHQPPFPLKVVGEGESERLNQAIEKTGRIQRLNKQGYQEVLELIGRAACLVFPSLWYETFGRSIAEAFSRGTPVIASDLGAMKELVRHGVTGYLFPPGNAGALARQLKCLAADRAETAAMRNRARAEFSERFSRERSYEQLMQIYSAAESAQARNLSQA